MINFCVLVGFCKYCYATSGAIGVDRSKASGTVNTITRYFADSTKDDIPLYMCPEGSTTNGDGLIRFKRGTFLPDVEVVPVCLHFEVSHFLDFM